MYRPANRSAGISLASRLDRVFRRYAELHSSLAKNSLLRSTAARNARERARRRPDGQAALTFLAPFIALVAASIVASAFAPHDQWLYPVKVAATGAALWWFRDTYLPLLSGASSSSVGIGLAVGALWIATDPNRGLETPLGVWLASLPLWLAAIWLGLAALGSIVVVPVAEELAFRGYLPRAP